ncbi:hypothetical protein ABFS82_05G005700 [Erythranthe guttata]|uniref:uncharacterized protein LOC105974709 n=1 Tax=Erythranthe guttata TaxID=4155 RepID=UPI00064DBB1A|nr:PREDICTED: uncharacterized protein LOC105974709 [Erythranthe guttata]|eukprot:XP_012855300.1 PREDICTED: uncharacterized protein LOC105974709 [Erythranthe guttata]
MSWDYESSDEDYPAAVAAAGYAIHSLDESEPLDQNKKINGPDKPLNETRTKTEVSWILPQLHKGVLSDETPRKSFENHEIEARASEEMPDQNAVGSAPEPSIKDSTSSSSSDSDETDSNKSGNSNNNNAAVEKADERAPPMKRPSTFADKHLYMVESEIAKTGPEISMADAWEKEEMASIQERHLRLIAIIDNWEMKKKKKADHKLENTKAKLEKTFAKAVQSHRDERMKATVENWEIKKKKNVDREIENIENKLKKRRAKAVQSHREKTKRIEEVAGGARAQAEENRRNEELKAKEKANKIKLTGKIPPTCLCF